ncbi:hypothetical protein [Pontibacter chinhatensis]|uniref:HEPN domain-containing protein n=1 Tax=Pontibacter chinhatensis TaxID=1436961 RepID=A0A1I2YIM0_9BACT|nr:hypothetical protein [Pontibacter chinhatensis]SFH25450.1 hypothetical protein SAMN05421739_10897 [Pontibacter chinhatensis]
MKPVFSGNEDYNKTAFLNWRISERSDILNLINIAEGFLISSIELAKHCLKDNQDKRADILIFPILTNANHGIELYLKAINWTLNQLLQLELKVEGKHNIKQIFSTVRRKVETLDGSEALREFDEWSRGLSDYINELSEKIESTDKADKMDFSRYPFSNRYENHFYVGEIGNVEVDLENLIDRLSAIKSVLESVIEEYYHYRLNIT